MTTPEQVAANRANAGRSCGPRTPEGKRTASMNALRHGGTAALSLLPDEDPEEAAQFSERLREAYDPRGPEQEILVGFITNGLWRLQRLSRVETGIMISHLYEKLGEQVDQEMESARPDGGAGAAANKRLQLRRKQVTDVDLAAQAFVHDASGPDALGKLSRYETAIANRVTGWMRELHELQSGQVNAG